LTKASSTGNSLTAAKRAYPDVEWRYLFLEQDAVDFPLDFRNETTWPLQEQGRDLAKSVLEATEQGFDGFLLLDNWSSNETLMRQTYGSFGAYYTSVLDTFR